MTSNEQWYYTDDAGAQQGPVSKPALMQMIASNEIKATNMVWKEGMADWLFVSQVLELAVSEPPAAVATPSPTIAPAENLNPYAPPSAPTESPSDEIDVFRSKEIIEYPGIGRLSYFLQLIAYVIGGILVVAMASFFNSLTLLVILLIIFIVVIIRLHYRRLINIGMSGWWIILMFIPLVNSIINIMLLSCPTGYSDTKKLDLPGIIVGSILILLYVISFFVDSSVHDSGDIFRELFQ